MTRRIVVGRIALAILPAWIAPLASAQHEGGCGCQGLSPHEATRARAHALTGAYDLPAGARGGAGLVSVPLAFHVVRRSNGTGGLDLARLDTALADANAAYAPAGIRFCQASAVDYIDDTAFYEEIDTQWEIDQLRTTNVVPDAINCYFTEELALPGFPLCGISSFTFSSVQGIVMRNSCTATATNHSTFVHELGHYFDLFHTHETAFGTECVNGSNCSTAGDLLCDTPADPRLSSMLVDPNCTYLGGPTDPCSGLAYAPLLENYMSYSRKHCRFSFTPQQEDKALATLLNLRPNLVREICGGQVSTFCGPSVINSSGARARLRAEGTAVLGVNGLVLRATNLPVGTWGYYLTSRTVSAPVTVTGARGFLCLGAPIGRFVGAGQIQNSGVAREIALTLDLASLPTPTGFVTALSGESWSFQLWFRDASLQVPTSSFTEGVSVTFD